MTPKTTEYTREELLQQRSELLSSVRMSLADFQELIRDGHLEGDEWYYAERLKEIMFLLGEDAA